MNRNEMTKSVQRKISLRPEEWNQVDAFIRREGYNDLRHMILAVSVSEDCVTMHEERQLQLIRNKSSKLQTLNNKIKSGIDVEKNMNEFVKEAERLCRELVC